MSKKDEETKNLPISVEDLIKKELAEQSGQLGALPSNKITLKNKEFTLPDGQKHPGPIELIILDFVWFMVHYPGVYNASNPQQPNCFAVGRDNPDSGNLKPHESVKVPQHTNCLGKEGGCPKNQWKSAASGNGKACKNQRRLIVVPPNFDEETTPMSMYVSPGGLKNFDSFVSRLKAEESILPMQAIVAVSFDKDQSYPLLKFKFVERHARVNDAWALREQIQPLLFRELEVKEDEKAA